MNMLLAEYDYPTDIAVQREEEREIALEEGLQQGAYQNKLETTRLMRLKNLGISLIAKVTGLSETEIENL